MSSCSSKILKHNENVTFVLNPSITYFKSVYRKHTKFSIDYKEEHPEGDQIIDADRSEITIPFHYAADLLCDISLKVRIGPGPGAPPHVVNTYTAVPPDIALHLIWKIKFNFQSLISDFDILDKEYINFYAMLNNPKSTKSTYSVENDRLTCNNGNNFQNMALCGGVHGTVGSVTQYKYMTAIIPLPFAFSKSIGTAIPLCAFNQKTTTPQIVIALDRRATEQLDSTLIAAHKYSTISKYIFLSDEERKRFQTTRLEYLYERVNSLPLTGTSNINISLLFAAHPIKQIFIQNNSAESSNILEYIIKINNAAMMNSNFHHDFFSKVEILNKFKGGNYAADGLCDNKIGVIDFSLKNTEGPSGCISPSNNVISLNFGGGRQPSINIHTVCYYLLRISDQELKYVFN